jgi:predicted acetyltransferase
VVSTLYASTLSLYRRVGYGSAGSRFMARMVPYEIPPMQSDLAVQRMEPEHHDEIAALYRDHAVSLPGHLERGPYIWPRLVQERYGVPAHGLLIRDDDGALLGWLAYRKHRTVSAYSRLEVTDWFAITAAAHRRIWMAVRDQGTVSREIELPTAPADPAYLVLPDPHFEVRLLDNWMVRIVDVAGALQARGYPDHAEATLDLRVDDDVLADNDGTWCLRVENGRGHVDRGGTGALRIDVRALASLFTGFADPWILARSGVLQGSPESLRTAAALFAGPLPWMREMF